MNIMYHYITSDHKPLLMSLGNIGVSGAALGSLGVDAGIGNTCIDIDTVRARSGVGDTNIAHGIGTTVTDWKHCDDYDLLCYRCALDDELCKINIPANLLELDSEDVAVSDGVKQSLDTYYNSIMDSIKTASVSMLPSKRVMSHYEQYITPGWNDIVSDKHAAARAAYIEWTFSGKRRNGPEFLAMQKTRAAFKLSLRYCR